MGKNYPESLFTGRPPPPRPQNFFGHGWVSRFKQAAPLVSTLN